MKRLNQNVTKTLLLMLAMASVCGTAFGASKSDEIETVYMSPLDPADLAHGREPRSYSLTCKVHYQTNDRIVQKLVRLVARANKNESGFYASYNLPSETFGYERIVVDYRSRSLLEQAMGMSRETLFIYFMPRDAGRNTLPRIHTVVSPSIPIDINTYESTIRGRSIVSGYGFLLATDLLSLECVKEF